MPQDPQAAQVPFQERTLDGHTYTAHYLDPDTALEMACELEHLILPALGQLATVAVDPDRISDAITQAVAKLVAATEPPRVQKLVRTMMSVVTCQGVGSLKTAYQAHFIGKFWTLIQVVAFAVEVNFLDFFDGLAGIRTWVAGRIEELEKIGNLGDSGSPPNADGTSGASS